MTDDEKDRLQSLLDNTGISFYRFKVAFSNLASDGAKLDAIDVFNQVLKDLLTLEKILKND